MVTVNDLKRVHYPLYYIVLYYIILYYIILYCIVLYYIINESGQEVGVSANGIGGALS